jgi:hypothetical protein
VTDAITIDQNRHVAADGTYRTAATSRGRSRNDVSKQWRSRPDDERHANLDDLMAHVQGINDACHTSDIDPKGIRVRASAENHDALALELPTGEIVAPTNWAFGQLAGLVGGHASYLRKLPARLAGACLQYHLAADRETELRSYIRKVDENTNQLRAMTSTQFGRITDASVVEAVQKVAGRGDGSGGFRWKTPGMIDWSSRAANGTVRYDPNIPTTKENTTLYASDRDIFIFLVDDRNPIEIGTLPDGSPDLVFRGFYVENSEVGAGKYRISSMLLRGVCENRCLWGCEGFQSVEFSHTKSAPDRFLLETMPTLEGFAESRTDKLVNAVRSAKLALVEKERQIKFLVDRGFAKTVADAALIACEREEGHPAQSIWDLCQGLTAHARSIPHNDVRLDVEKRAGALFDAAAG